MFLKFKCQEKLVLSVVYNLFYLWISCKLKLLKVVSQGSWIYEIFLL